MESVVKEALWNQFGASIDMLENAILKCPDKLWYNGSKFWYKAYHCIFWTDYYLTLEPKQFLPPPGYSLSEFDPSGVMPERVYSKDELLSYLRHCREKCHSLISKLTFETATARWVNDYKNYSIIEILIYNVRHIQHHTGQLNMILRQAINDAPGWVSQAKGKL
jgi:DinB superfamily